jgi:hypothetical protein
VNRDRGGSAPTGGSATVDGKRRRFGRARDDGSGETSMVDRAEFASYYGRPVLKPPVWTNDIAYYFFLGGLAAGSSLLAAGADRTGRSALRRGSRLGAAAAISAGSAYLIKDLGRPERFHHMLRVAKLTSPMSVGTWILTAYGPLAGLAAVAEVIPGRLRGRLVGRLLTAAGRLAGLGAALLAPAVASYTSVLISDTAVPAWHEALDVLPFIFTGSAAASAGGLGMIVAPVAEAAPARRLALYGAIVEITASRKLEGRGTAAAEPYLEGEAGRRLKRASALTVGGVLGSWLFGRRNRLAAVASGIALLLGGLYERLGIFQAGVESAKKTTS